MHIFSTTRTPLFHVQTNMPYTKHVLYLHIYYVVKKEGRLDYQSIYTRDAVFLRFLAKFGQNYIFVATLNLTVSIGWKKNIKKRNWKTFHVNYFVYDTEGL